MLRLGVMVSGGGTNLQAIIDKIHSGELVNCEIVTVVSSRPGVYALERALKMEFLYHVFQRKTLLRQMNTRRLCSTILRNLKWILWYWLVICPCFRRVLSRNTGTK